MGGELGGPGRRVDRWWSRKMKAQSSWMGLLTPSSGPERRAPGWEVDASSGPGHPNWACSRQLQARVPGRAGKWAANRLWAMGPLATRRYIFLPLTAHPMASAEVTVRG